MDQWWLLHRRLARWGSTGATKHFTIIDIVIVTVVLLVLEVFIHQNQPKYNFLHQGHGEFTFGGEKKGERSPSFYCQRYIKILGGKNATQVCWSIPGWLPLWIWHILLQGWKIFCWLVNLTPIVMYHDNFHNIQQPFSFCSQYDLLKVRTIIIFIVEISSSTIHDT